MCAGRIVGVNPPIVGTSTFHQFLVVVLVLSDDKHDSKILYQGATKKNRQFKTIVFDNRFKKTLFSKKMTTFELEQPYWDQGRVVIGVDEVGRGSLCGPVVVAAVAFAPNQPILKELNDSKQLTPNRRNYICCNVQRTAQAYTVTCRSARVSSTSPTFYKQPSMPCGKQSNGWFARTN